jgi:hypothetical protein
MNCVLQPYGKKVVPEFKAQVQGRTQPDTLVRKRSASCR